MSELPEPEVELLPDLEDDVPDLALVPVPALALVDDADELLPVVPVLLVLPDEEEALVELPEPDLEDDPELPLVPVFPLIKDDEPDDPVELPDVLPELWFFSLSFIV